MRYENDDEEWQTHVYNKQRRSNFEWLALIFVGVFLAILAADGMRYLIVKTWVNHQLEQAAKEIQQISDRAVRSENERAAQEKAIADRRAYERKFNSNECKFWREMHQRNPGQKTTKGIAEHCP